MIATLRSASALLLSALLIAACDTDARSAGEAVPFTAAAGGAATEGDTELDALLARHEAAVEHRVDEAALGCWRDDQDAFRRALAACGDGACRSGILLQRISSLDYLQPQATRTKRELPTVPSLIAVLAPDPDAPDEADPALTPFEARGNLVHASEHPEHMGLAVQVQGGSQHVFILDMFIDAEAGQREVLGLLEAHAPRQVQVRGFSRVESTGVPNFDTNRCRWVYLLP
jgi:hypothetical protein